MAGDQLRRNSPFVIGSLIGHHYLLMIVSNRTVINVRMLIGKRRNVCTSTSIKLRYSISLVSRSQTSSLFFFCMWAEKKAHIQKKKRDVWLRETAISLT